VGEELNDLLIMKDFFYFINKTTEVDSLKKHRKVGTFLKELVTRFFGKMIKR